MTQLQTQLWNQMELDGGTLGIRLNWTLGS
jgi:hypothetical protein